MRILFVTDAWQPQLNGVVRTIEETSAELQRRGHIVEVIGPDQFPTIPLPTYRDIRLALPSRRKLSALIENFTPDYIHIATEGPLGWAARRWCLRHGRGFTTAYHSRFPEYLAARFPIPVPVSYAALRRFHKPSIKTMAPTQSIVDDLVRHRFCNVTLWTRGVDASLFRPLPNGFADLQRPILLYAGRVAVEKNLDAFLSLQTPGTKIIVGDGPQMDDLKRRYPDVHFTGRLAGDDLVRAYSAADVFVFPSLTDTFGLVLVEALACGTPIAAHDVPGPRDVLAFQAYDSPVGVLGPDLKTAIQKCLELQVPVEKCRDFAVRHYSWALATDQFLDMQTGICDHIP